MKIKGNYLSCKGMGKEVVGRRESYHWESYHWERVGDRGGHFPEEVTLQAEFEGWQQQDGEGWARTVGWGNVPGFVARGVQDLSWPVGLEDRGRSRPVVCILELSVSHPLSSQICSNFEMKGKNYSWGGCGSCSDRSDLLFEKIILDSWAGRERGGQLWCCWPGPMLLSGGAPPPGASWRKGES